jgi:tetratricopeptide (TPR) repeat protein
MNPNERFVSKLRQKQKELGLTDSDTGLEEMAPILAQPMPRQEDVAFYEQMFAEMAQQRLPLHDSDRRELQYFQQSFHLSDEDVFAIEQQVLAAMGFDADSYDITNEPPPVSKFPVSPPGMTVAPQDSYSSVGSNTPTQPSRPAASAGLTAAQNAVIQRLGYPDPASAQPSAPEAQLPPIPPTQAPPEAVRSPAPPTADATPPAQPPAAPQETVVQPPAANVAPAEPPAAKPGVIAVPATPEATPAVKKQWWLDKSFLIPFFGLLAALTGIAIIFGMSRQFLQPTTVDPQAAQQFVQSGTQSMQQGQYQAAIKSFDEALRLNPNDDKTYINRGYARHRVGDLNGAIADYNQAIELNGNSAEAFNNRSHVRFDQGQFDNSVKDASRALELNANLPEANVNLGNAFFAQGDLDRAAQQFQSVLQSAASSQTKSRAHNNRGNIFLARNQVTEAGGAYDQAIQLDPQYADAFFNRGLANERSRNFPAAANDFKDAARLYQAQGNRSRSRDAQSKAERMQRESPSTPLPPGSSNQQAI